MHRAQLLGRARWDDFKVLTPDVVQRWLFNVARRELDEREMRALKLVGYRGWEGAEDFDLFGYVASSPFPPSFEMLRWTLKLSPQIEAEALLGTSVTVSATSDPPLPGRLHVIRVLTGQIIVREGGRTSVFGKNDLCVLRAGDLPTFSTTKLTSVIYLNLPASLIDEDPGFPMEQSRLISLLELARAMLVEQLTVEGSLEGSVQLLKHLLSPPHKSKQGTGKASRAREIRQSAELLVSQSFTDPNLDVETLAAELHVSLRQLHRAFEGAEHTAGSLIDSARLKAATELLRANPGRSFREIAAASGHRSVDHLRRSFVRQMNITPRDYRAELRGGTAE